MYYRLIYLIRENFEDSYEIIILLDDLIHHLFCGFPQSSIVQQ